MDPAASDRNAHHSASVLTDGYGDIRSGITESLRCNLTHLSVSDNHADFAMHVISLFPQTADCLMDHRRISMCKRSFCLDLFARGHCHAEKDFQHTVRGKMFSRKIECILDLCKDLIFSKNL